MSVDLLFIPFLFFVAALSVLGTISWVWMLVDCLMSESSQRNDKIIWTVVILATCWVRTRFGARKLVIYDNSRWY